MPPDPPPVRPRRRLPTLCALVAYWEPLGIFEIDPDQPHCFGCSVVVQMSDGPFSIRWQHASSLLDKAHLVDRALDGLDGPQNLVPLCKRCHRSMPRFISGPAAIEWVRTGGRMTIDEMPRPDAELAPCAQAGGSHSVADERQCRRAVARVRAIAAGETYWGESP